MTHIVVRFAVLVIIASILPGPSVRAQGQNVLTSRGAEESSVIFPCAAGVVEKQDQTRVQKTKIKIVTKAAGPRRSRKMERRL